jgi:hypothetical protein
LFDALFTATDPEGYVALQFDSGQPAAAPDGAVFPPIGS